MKSFNTESYAQALKNTDPFEYGGRISQILGLTIEALGLTANLGDICRVYTEKRDRYILSEVVGFKENKVVLMPFGDLSGAGPKSYVISDERSLNVPVAGRCAGECWMGWVIRWMARAR